MGHGDKTVLAADNFLATSIAQRLIHVDGHGVPEFLEAVWKQTGSPACGFWTLRLNLARTTRICARRSGFCSQDCVIGEVLRLQKACVRKMISYLRNTRLIQCRLKPILKDSGISHN